MGQGEVLRINTDNLPPTVSIEVDVSVVDFVGYAEHLYIREYEETRCLVVECPPKGGFEGRFAFIWDIQNDGVFDPNPQILGYPEFYNLGLLYYVSWSQDFVHYP